MLNGRKRVTVARKSEWQAMCNNEQNAEGGKGGEERERRLRMLDDDEMRREDVRNEEGEGRLLRTMGIDGVQSQRVDIVDMADIAIHRSDWVYHGLVWLLTVSRSRSRPTGDRRKGASRPLHSSCIHLLLWQTGPRGERSRSMGAALCEGGHEKSRLHLQTPLYLLDKNRHRPFASPCICVRGLSITISRNRPLQDDVGLSLSLYGNIN